MKFNKNLEIANKHSFLAPSNYHWINYDAETLKKRFQKSLAMQRGTELHDLAYRLIKNGVKLPRSNATLNKYVNDCISYKMIPEQPLYYSKYCFGTADAISFKNLFLRISDFKSGETKASMNQLFVYAAIFCLEYGYNPNDITIECRIYQNDELFISSTENDDPDDIRLLIINIMGVIVEHSKMLTELDILVSEGLF